MRLLLFAALIIGGLVYGAFALFKGEGLYARLGKESIGDKITHPTRFLTDKDKTTDTASTVRQDATPPQVPHQVSLLPQAVPVPQAPLVNQAPQAPLVNQVPQAPQAPEDVIETRTHRFTDRLPPDAAGALAALGVNATIDQATRSLVMRGTSEDLLAASQALATLDMPADGCNARVWAVYVDSTQSEGWDLVAAVQAVAHADIGFSVGAGRATLDLTGDEIAASLAVIADGALVDVVQRPQLALLHGQESIVESTSEVPLLTLAVAGSGISQSGVTYRKVGLSCRIKAWFLGRNRVRLDVSQENGLIGAMQELGQGLSAPVIETQRVASSVEITVGQAVVLGGVATERKVTRKGLLRDTEETRRGALYVILATSSLAPRALPVDAWDLVAPGVLPGKSWEAQEVDFLESVK